MAMKMKPRGGMRTDPEYPGSDPFAQPSTVIGTTEAEAVAEDGSLRGFLAGFLNSQGVTGDGLDIPYDALPLPLARGAQEVADVKQVSEEMVFTETLTR